MDGLRGLAILLVMAHHATFWGTAMGRGWQVTSVVFGTIGYIGVHLFLIVSGFCLFYPLVKHGGPMRALDWRVFAIRRLKRICPPYYAAIAIAVGVQLALLQTAGWAAFLTAHHKPILTVDPWDILSHVVFAHNLLPAYSGTIDGAFWSIGLEMQLYLVFPLVVLLVARFGLWRTMAGLMVGVLAYRLGLAALDGAHPGLAAMRPLNSHVLARWSEFGLGMLAAAMAAAHPATKRLYRCRPAVLAMVGLAAMLLGTWTVRAQGPFVWYLDFAWAIGFFCLLAVAIRTDRVKGWLSWRPLTFVGRISYSAYLLHGTVFLAAAWVLQRLGVGPGWDYALITTVGVMAVLGVSVLSHRWIEQPFMTSK